MSAEIHGHQKNRIPLELELEAIVHPDVGTWDPTCFCMRAIRAYSCQAVSPAPTSALKNDAGDQIQGPRHRGSQFVSEAMSSTCSCLTEPIFQI